MSPEQLDQIEELLWPAIWDHDEPYHHDGDRYRCAIRDVANRAVRAYRRAVADEAKTPAIPAPRWHARWRANPLTAPQAERVHADLLRRVVEYVQSRIPQFTSECAEISSDCSDVICMIDLDPPIEVWQILRRRIRTSASQFRDTTPERAALECAGSICDAAADPSSIAWLYYTSIATGPAEWYRTMMYTIIAALETEVCDA